MNKSIKHNCRFKEYFKNVLLKKVFRGDLRSEREFLCGERSGVREERSDGNTESDAKGT
jgi:hypothetical protein